MRLLPALLATVLASTTIIQTAAACGGPDNFMPAPVVLGMSTHATFVRGHTDQRAFVVLEQPLQTSTKGTWKLVAPGTYDSAKIMALAALPRAVEVTLVGPSGARVIKTRNQVGLAHALNFGWDEQHLALEVPVGDKDQFTIAIVGRASDATWNELEYKEAPVATTWWLAMHGAGDASYVGLRTLAGSSTEILEYEHDGTSRFIVRDGDAELGFSEGRPLGIVTTGGHTFVAFRVNSQVGVLEVPASVLPATTRA